MHKVPVQASWLSYTYGGNRGNMLLYHLCGLPHGSEAVSALRYISQNRSD